MPENTKKRGWPRLRIRHKIILCIYLVLFPALILAWGFTYYQSYRMVVNENTRRYQAAVQALDENIRYLEQDLADISTYFCVDDAIIRVLSGRTTGEDRLFWTREAPMEFIRSILAIKSQIRTLAIYPENGLPPFYVSRDASVPLLNIEDVRELDIYKTAVEARGDNVRGRANIDDQGLFLYNKSDKIVFCREIFDLSKRRKLGFLALSVDVRWYGRICENALLYENEAIVILDGIGVPTVQVGNAEEGLVEYLSANHPLPEPPTGEFTQYKGSYIFASSRNPSGETIYYLSPKQNWNEWIRSGLAVPVLLAVALLVCIWPLSALASQIISRPLSQLYLSMNRFKEGDFGQQVLVEGDDEIAELSETFNTMVRDIRDLIDRNYVMVLHERESELNALQAQINPHFLYNALDSLYWQAMDIGQESLSDNILSLSELFRLLLSSGQSEIAVRQELHLISHYLHIQKMRFPKKLDYRIDVDDAILGYPILKLMLQPFVENAIVHGLERKDTWGFVGVTGKLENDMLRFTIEDNGAGMTGEQIESVLGQGEDRRYANQRIGHYAIRNVKERLALRYGGHFRLQLESTVGKGTAVYIEIPAESQ